MDFRELEKVITELVADLKPAELQAEPVQYESTTFDGCEKNNDKWIELISEIWLRQRCLRSTAGMRSLNG